MGIRTEKNSQALQETILSTWYLSPGTPRLMAGWESKFLLLKGHGIRAVRYLAEFE